jgi:hypothetical protein
MGATNMQGHFAKWCINLLKSSIYPVCKNVAIRKECGTTFVMKEVATDFRRYYVDSVSEEFFNQSLCGDWGAYAHTYQLNG